MHQVVQIEATAPVVSLLLLLGRPVQCVIQFVLHPFVRRHLCFNIVGCRLLLRQQQLLLRVAR